MRRKGGGADVQAAHNTHWQAQHRWDKNRSIAQGARHEAKGSGDPAAKRGMDISDTSMSRLEGQTRLVQDFEIPVLAKALNVSIEWLLEQEEE